MINLYGLALLLRLSLCFSLTCIFVGEFINSKGEFHRNFLLSRLAVSGETFDE